MIHRNLISLSGLRQEPEDLRRLAVPLSHFLMQQVLAQRVHVKLFFGVTAARDKIKTFTQFAFGST